MKENWTNDIKQKLEGHKMAPPAGLWEDISSEMGFPKKSASKRWYWLALLLKIRFRPVCPAFRLLC